MRYFSVTLLRATLMAALLGVFISVSAAGPLEDAEAAYQAGNYPSALRLFQLLANQGNAQAQHNVGVIYANGRGVPQDYILAHMWFNLAASQGDADAAEAREQVAKSMSPTQVAEAQKMAREWKPKSDGPAKKRIPNR